MARLVVALVVSALCASHSNAAFRKKTALERNEQAGLQVIAELEDELLGPSVESPIIGQGLPGLPGPDGAPGMPGFVAVEKGQRLAKVTEQLVGVW